MTSRIADFPVPGPMSTVTLPPVDPTTPMWTGSHEEAGGVRLHVRRTPGSPDRTAVFVHGLGGSSANWTDLAGQLAGHANGIAVDLPGCGWSDPIKGYRYGVVEAADALARFLRGLDVGKVDLFGNSLGGATSVVLAARHPDLVRSMVLVSPAMPDLRPRLDRLSDPRMVLALVPVIGAGARRDLASLSPRERVEQVLELCYADGGANVSAERLAESEADYAGRMRLPWYQSALMASMFGLWRLWMQPPRRSLWSYASRVSAPTLVVWGTTDRLVTVRKAPKTARTLRNARLLVLADTGHVAMMEHPETVARATLGMWEAVDAGTW